MIEESNFKSRIKNACMAVRLFRNWPAFIYRYLRHPHDPAVFHMRNGLELTLRPGTSDFRIVREIMVAQDYVRPGFEITPSFCVVDVGAQIGLFSIYAARLASQGRVVSFEPHPDNFKMLEANRAANRFDHMVIYNRAVAEEEGEREFYVSPVNTGGHSLYPSGSSRPSFKVRTVRMDDVLREQGIKQIDFLKMDCEGAEREILSTLPDTVLAGVQRIVMEVHDEKDTTDEGLAGWMRARGFDVQCEGAMVYARRASA